MAGRVRRRKPRQSPAPRRWGIPDARELYMLDKWGLGFFDINRKGNVVVRPAPRRAVECDLKSLIDELVERGIDPPVLLRFTNILRSRLDQLNRGFQDAIKRYGFQGRYRGVYPIKVNQHRQVVEDVIEFGRRHDFGLEAGSKPELLLAIALQDNDRALIVCNGYKDREFVETALLATKLGRQVILVVEKLTEVPMILEQAERLGVEPNLGVRVKLAAPGRGKWESSGGDRSKFGLSVLELLRAVELLREAGKLSCFQLLHFHLGSQVTAIQAIKAALTEAAKIFTELHRLGAPLRYFDAGGGLAVDYDGSKADFPSSANYSLREYASDVVSAISEACGDAGIPHPDIITESGRALVAHHSVLVFEVLGTHELGQAAAPEPAGEPHEQVSYMLEVEKGLNRKNFQESYHDAVQIKSETLDAFNLGYLGIEDRALVELAFWRICRKIVRFIRELELNYVPEELEGLESMLSDTYFANFSVFQSAPDHWAVRQLFPVMPIHRLNRRPKRKAVLADITCDSDGKMDQFIDLRDVKPVVDLHEVKAGEPYYLGVFLIGAYQEILGDLHNLFGDSNTVHVTIREKGQYKIDRVIPGDTVSEVLSYVQYNREELVSAMRRAAELGVAARRITLKESKQILRQYEEGLAGYTYLEKD